MLKQTITAILMASAALCCTAERPALHFNDNGAFKILQFTDLHINDENDASKLRNDSTYRLIESLTETQKPDLLVLTGDCVWNTRDAISLWKQLCASLESTGVPYAVCFGNHDEETDVNNSQILDYLLTQPHNLTRDDADISGSGNCLLSVAASSSDPTTAAAVYMIDSHNSCKDRSFGGYAWINHDQIDWYRSQSDSLTRANGGKPVPAVAFFHIPLPEFDTLLNKYPATGSKKENVCAPGVNSGLFESMLEKGDVLGVFVGHDHNNDYLIDANGKILLAYGRKSGYNSAYDEVLPRGARVITLHKGERRLDTAVIDEFGTHHPYTFIKKDFNK